MENLFIDQNQKEFKRLCELTNLSEIQIISPIYTWMKIHDIDLDAKNDAGLNLQYLLDEFLPYFFPECSFGFKAFCYDVLGEYDEEIAFCLGRLKLKNVLCDCPDCGCEVEYRNEQAWGYHWQEKQCTNPSCNYATTTEPDWDADREG